MSQKNHFTVVRNQANGSGAFNVRERHNERKNECYGNGDIVPERFDMNVHFRRVISPAGSPETYEQTFNRLLDEGVITKRGLKPDANVFDELVFDVNSTYFEERGGYEYAKVFFEEAYRLAVKEIGGEQFILSAILHADERNKDLSDRHGKDIFHYHLHVVYVPVVQKEVYYRKDMKDKEKAGKLKEVITQISHSKKWPIKTPVERDGKTFTVNAYSLLQDRYYEHMRAAGFEGFERGERGSTAEHLADLEFKTKKENERLAEKTAAADEKQNEVETLDEKLASKKARLDKLDEQITVREKAKATIAEVDSMGHSLPLVPGVHLSDNEAKKLKSLAKKGVGIDKRAEEYKKKINALDGNIRELNGQINQWKQSYQSAILDRDAWKANYERLWGEVREFIGAIRSIPQKLRAFISEHLPGQKNKNQEVSL